MKINTIKRLYHGTDRQFETFNFNCASGFKDFGKGFYLISNFQCNPCKPISLLLNDVKNNFKKTCA